MQSALGERRWRLHARVLKDNWYRLLPNAATLELHPTMPIDGSIDGHLPMFDKCARSSIGTPPSTH